MKKALITSLTATLLVLATYNSYSQTANTAAKFDSGSSLNEFNTSHEEINTPKESPVVLLNKISAKAVRNFTRDYKIAKETKWSISSNGLFVAYFIGENIRTWVFYNKQGGFECMIRHYDEEKLPREVRQLVKSTYYNFNIYHVTETSRNGKLAYGIKLEDKTSWKTIKVVDDEMEVMEEYLKN